MNIKGLTRTSHPVPDLSSFVGGPPPGPVPVRTRWTVWLAGWQPDRIAVACPGWRPVGSSPDWWKRDGSRVVSLLLHAHAGLDDSPARIPVDAGQYCLDFLALLRARADRRGERAELTVVMTVRDGR